MIDLYAWPTPNGYKISILLEELGLPYTVIPIDIGKGDQFKPEFLTISPNNKMPAIVDHEGPGGKPLTVFESGAIMMYLAEREGKFMPSETRARYQVIEWLMFQMGGVGPMLGQAHHFRQYAPEPIPYAIDRYTNEAGRLYRVINKRLGEVDFLASEYSIADMAVYPWLRSWEKQGQKITDYPNIQRWMAAIDARPAVQRGLTLLQDNVRKKPITEEERSVMFGDKQFKR